MRVAFISFDFAEYCVRLATALTRDARVLLCLPEQDSEPYRNLLGSSVEASFFRKARLRDPFGQSYMLAKIVSAVKNFDPDVIHIQAGHLWFTVALPMLRRRPLVLTIHDPSRHIGDVESRRTPDWVLDRGCYRARERIVHAPQLKDALVQRLGLQPSTVHVIPHILIGDDGDTSHIPEEPNHILFFGRIWEYKGLEYLIKAEPLITAKVPEAKIVIAGRGETFEHYRRMMVHSESFIVHNERVSDAKRAELFRRASVVVLPYIEASQSGVIPLAYRFGKTVVATTVGGLPAMVDDGKTGYLVPPRDAKALADSVIRLLQDEQLRRRLGENGRRKVNLECAPEVVADMTLNVYRQAVSRP